MVKDISNQWNRDTRNTINDNFRELYGKYYDFYVEVSKDIVKELMENSTIQFLDPVDTVDELDNFSGLTKGDTSFVTEDGSWYRWNGEEWKPVAKTDPSEFISLQDSFNKINDAFNDLRTLTEDAIGQMVYVVEEGRNENGNYIRYSDGYQVCWGEPFSQAITESLGDIYRSESTTWTFPKPFDSNTPVFTSASTNNAARWAGPSGTGSNTSVSIRQFSGVETSALIITRVSAIGRWKP